MNDRADFERRLSTALAAYAERAPVDVDAGSLSRAVTRGRAPRRWRFPAGARSIGWPASQRAALLIVLGVTVALLIGAIAVGAFRPDPVKNLLDGRAILTDSPTPSPAVTSSAAPSARPAPTSSVSPKPLPTAQIPAGLHPTMTPQQAAQQVLDTIARGEQTLGYAITPAKITAIRLLSPGSTFKGADGDYTATSLTWAVTAEGTFAECILECGVNTGETAFIPDDGTSDGNIVGTGAPGYAFPDQTFLGELDMQGQLFRVGTVPTSGVLTPAAVLAITRTSGLTATPSLLPRNMRQTTGPIYGLVSCVDPTKGCQALGADPLGPTLAVWWVRFPTDAGRVWIAVDAATGRVLERSSPDGTIP